MRRSHEFEYEFHDELNIYCSLVVVALDWELDYNIKSFPQPKHFVSST